MEVILKRHKKLKRNQFFFNTHVFGNDSLLISLQTSSDNFQIIPNIHFSLGFRYTERETAFLSSHFFSPDRLRPLNSAWRGGTDPRFLRHAFYRRSHILKKRYKFEFKKKFITFWNFWTAKTILRLSIFLAHPTSNSNFFIFSNLMKSHLFALRQWNLFNFKFNPLFNIPLNWKKGLNYTLNS